jgi:hypothetical protein
MDSKCKDCPYKIAHEFKRPTLEEVRAYAQSLGWTNFDAELFLAKQDSVGWVIPLGNKYVPVANWQGVVMVWFKAAQRRGDIKPATKGFKDRYEESKG